MSCSFWEEDVYDITPDLRNYSEAETNFSELSIKYYDMFIKVCKDRGIQVVAVLPPKISEAARYAARWDAEKEYFESRGRGLKL